MYQFKMTMVITESSENKIFHNQLELPLFFFLVFISWAFQGQNVERELEMGQKTKAQLEQQIGFYDHSSATYVTEIGQWLVSNLENRVFDYRFGILDMKEPNAMAIPGGEIYFSRGILLLANSEEELGGVMGHEIIHIYKSHSRKSSNRSIWTGIFKVPGAIVGVFAPTAGGILMAPFAMFDAGYSRKNEKQSDELGAQLAAKSGYNPEGLATILERMSSESEMETGMEEQRSFFSTHPYTPKRIQELDKTIKKINFSAPNSTQSTKEEFLNKIEGIVIGDNPAHGMFHESKFLHPELNISMVYPKGWEGIITPMFVGFVTPDKKAQMLVSLADTINSPSKYAGEFENEYNRYYGYKPKRNETLDINGFPAHILTYEGQSEGGLVVLNFLWLKRKEYTFRFATLGTEKYRNIITETAINLHTLTVLERQEIKQTVLKIVKARSGETLSELSKRTLNVLDLDFLALINDLEKNDKLSENQLLKVGVAVQYK